MNKSFTRKHVTCPECSYDFGVEDMNNTVSCTPWEMQCVECKKIWTLTWRFEDE